MNPLLEVVELRKAFGGIRAVDRVSFRIHAGEVAALIGPNGAGKTTCFHLISGFLKPDGGRVRFLGKETAGRSPQHLWRLGLGRTFQHSALFSSMTAAENVQMALFARKHKRFPPWGSFRRQDAAEARSLLARVGLLDQAERPAQDLAYADLKRLEVAVALAHRPKLLLLDEPTAGMALGERFALMQRLVELSAQMHVALLFTEHDMEVVFRFARRILVMDRGRLIAQGTPREVRADPRVQDAYLGSAVLGSPGPS